MASNTARWDWYEATFEEVEDGEVAWKLAIALGATITNGRARNGYARCQVIERDDSVLAQVHSHSSRPLEVHVTITSDACDDVVPLLRSLWPDHRVSRADAAVDFRADFDALDSVVLAFAQERRIAYRLVTNSDGGATRYLGSPTSETMVRVYKKTEQLRALHPDRAAEIPDGIVRFEGQVRPGKRAAKEALAHLEPADVFGFAKWSHALSAQVLGIEAERTRTQFRRPTDYDRALHFLGEQYGKTIQARMEAVGAAQAASEVLTALGVTVDA